MVTRAITLANQLQLILGKLTSQYRYSLYNYRKHVESTMRTTQGILMREESSS